MMRIGLLFAILMSTWLLMSGHYTLLITSLGIVSCLFAALMSHRIGGTDHAGLPTHLFARLPAYLVWLCREIISSNIATGKTILFGGAKPQFFEVEANQSSDAGVATYANSITLTPGTVTVDLRQTPSGETVFLVQALTTDFANDVKSGEMDQRVTALEGERGASG